MDSPWKRLLIEPHEKGTHGGVKWRTDKDHAAMGQSSFMPRGAYKDLVFSFERAPQHLLPYPGCH